MDYSERDVTNYETPEEVTVVETKKRTFTKPRGRLQPGDREKIIEMYATKQYTQKVLAEKFGVSGPYVSLIVTGKDKTSEPTAKDFRAAFVPMHSDDSIF